MKAATFACVGDKITDRNQLSPRTDAQTLAQRLAHSKASLSRENEKEQTLKQACFQGYPEIAVYVRIQIGSTRRDSK